MHQIKRPTFQSWIWPVSLLAMVTGFMGAAAWIGDRTRTGRLESLPESVRERLASGKLDAQAELAALHEEVTKLRDENTKLQGLVAEGGKGTSALNESLQDTKLFAGLTEVTGPGITVELRDSKKSLENFLDPGGGVIHDTDVLKIVNELWNAGAEAISVNGKRVGPRSNFRCVGSTILIDSVRIAPPIRIEAIGDPQTLAGAMNMPGGPVEEIRIGDPNMVEITIVEAHKLGAYAGTMASKFAHLPDKQPASSTAKGSK